MNSGFNFQTYGERLAHMLAIEWCRKLQHFHNMYLPDGSLEFECTRDLVAQYFQDAALTDAEAA